MSASTEVDRFQPHYYPEDPVQFREKRVLRQNGHTYKDLAGSYLGDLPSRVDSALSWDGSALKSADYVFQLSEAHLREIERACAEFMESGRELREISQETFKIPSLAENLAERRSTLHTGVGMLLLRGLVPSSLSRRENVCVFAGLASHLCEEFGKQSGGKVLVHIKDLASIDQLNGLNGCAAPYCNVALPLHTDVGDVVAMYALETTDTGGYGTFASVESIYNVLARDDPELLATLFKDDWPMDHPPDKKGLDGKGLYYRRPIMLMHNGAPEMVFSRGAIIRSPRGLRPLAIPNVTMLQNDALDAVHFAAQESLHRIGYEAGDLLFFNNRKIIHGRDEFHDGKGKNRHMLRLWLKDEGMAGLPPHPALQLQWRKVFRAGLSESSEDAEWPMEPDKL